MHAVEMDSSKQPISQTTREPGEQGLAAQWEKARNPIFAQLLAQLGSPNDAEDVLQEVAVCVSKDYHKYDPERSFTAWALGIARNQALMFLRKQSRDRLAFGTEMMHIVETHLSESSLQEVEYRRQALQECVQKLSESRRNLLAMRYAGDLRLAEISKRSGKSITAIKGQLYRLRKILADCIEHRLSGT